MAATLLPAALAVAGPAAAGTRPYVIAQQDLAKAIVALALQSGRNIVYPAEVVAGKRSGPVSGSRTFEDALKRLLAGSNLVGVVQMDGSVVISVADPRANPGPPAPVRPPERRAPLRPPERIASPPRPGAEPDVVVTGRSAPAPLAPTSSAERIVLTGAELEGLADHNITEALARSPGVTVLDGGSGATNSVPVDFAGRGEGGYVSIRGLDAEFNLTMINGVDVAEGQAYSRGVQLSLLPTLGLSQLVLDKILGPEVDRDAIGGVLDYRTPGAFDFRAPVQAAVSLGGQVEDEAARYGRNPFGASIFAEGSRRFGGRGQFGLYVAAYDDEETFSNGVVDGAYPAEINQMFAYRLETANGASAPGLDPAKNLVLTGLDLGLSSGRIRRYGGDLAFDWRPGERASAYFRVDAAAADTTQASDYLQIYGHNITAAPAGSAGLYSPVIGSVQPRYYYETNPETATLDTVQAGGTLKESRLSLAVQGFASWAENDDPDHFELSGRQPEIGPGLSFGGQALFAATGGAPRLLLSAADLETIADIPSYGARRAGELSREFSSQLKYGAKLDATYAAGSPVSVLFGAKYENADRTHTYRDYTSELLYTTDANDPSFGALGFLGGAVKTLAPGVFPFAVSTVDGARAMAFFNANIARYFGTLSNALDTCGAADYPDNFNCDTQHGSEAVASAYVAVRLQAGALTATPGLRYEQTGISNTYWVTAQAADGAAPTGHFATEHTSYREPLPSLELDYRASRNLGYRAAIWSSYVRPAMYQLGGSAQIESTSAGTTSIVEGNPGLRAMQALNLDLSADWTGAHGENVSAGAFYKALSHYIFDSVNSFTNLTATSVGGTVISRPQNGGAGRVYGLELSGRRPLWELAAPLNRLGAAANLTVEGSRVDTEAPGLSRNERLLDQPDLQANLELFYQHGGADLRLSYRYTSPYVGAYGALGATSALDTWVRAARTLNLLMSYRMAQGVKISASVANLLDNVGYAATIGAHSWTIPTLVYAGRTFLLTAKVSY